jgi:hypothetical protein
MAEMTEVNLASWNAAMAFGDDLLSRERLEKAFTIVEGLRRLGTEVLAIPELALCTPGEKPLSEERKREIRGTMGEIGFKYGKVTTGLRDDLYLSLWSIHDEEIGTVPLGDDLGELPVIRMPGIGRVTGLHDLSDNEPHRQRVAHALERLYANKDGVIMGDFNARYLGDSGSMVLKSVDTVTRWLPRFNYVSRNKAVWAAGVLVRTAGMARGGTMKTFERAGFIDADPSHQPTVFLELPKTSIEFRQCIDHMLSTAGVMFSGFEVLPRTVQEGDKPVSDHAPIRSIATQQRPAENIRYFELALAA